MSFHLVYSLLLLQFVLGYAPFDHNSPGIENVKPPTNDISNPILYYLSSVLVEYIIVNNIVIVKLYSF